MGVVSGTANKIVLTGSGPIFCSGNYGSIIAYDSANAIVGQTPISILAPDDCSPSNWPDNVTGWTLAELDVGSARIKKFEITAMDPLSGPVFRPSDGTYTNGNFYQNYSISVKGPPGQLKFTCTPPTSIRATATVRCVATMTDGSAFTPKHLKSTNPSGNLIVEGDISVSATTAYEWPGPAVVSANVEITADIGGRDTVAKGSFTVTSRIGLVANWLSEDFPDAVFPNTLPTRIFSKTSPPFTAAYPGFSFSDTLLAAEGTIGVTIFPYPTNPTLGTVGTGPNQTVTFIQRVLWTVKPEYGAFPPGIYLQASLDSRYPFFKKQKGPSPYCTQKQMDSLYNAVLKHEQTHWVYAHTFGETVNVLRVLDSVAVLPASEGGNQRALETWERMALVWRDSMDSSIDFTHAIERDYPNCKAKP